MVQKIALLVGNDEYTDAKLEKLTVPLADVRALQAVLERADISAFDQVDTMINPSFAEVQRAIAAVFAKRKRDDLVLLYFSGHGVRDAAGHLYLALKNTEFDLLAGTAVSSTFLKEVMDKSRSHRQILILDCCHSGAFGRGAKSATGAAAVTEATFEVQGYGRTVLTSSGETQLSFEGDQFIGDTDRSLFTHYLVEGLETGKAAPEGEDAITVEQLYQYAHDHVAEKNPNQKPGWWVDRGQGEMVFARNPHPVIKAKDLPSGLLDDLNSDNPRARSGAIIELGRLLRGDDEGYRLAAENALRERKKKERDRYTFEEIEKALNFVERSFAEPELEEPEKTPAAPRASPKPAAGIPVSQPEEKVDTGPKKRGAKRPRLKLAPKPMPTAATETPTEPAGIATSQPPLSTETYSQWWMAPWDSVANLARHPKPTFKWLGTMLAGLAVGLLLSYPTLVFVDELGLIRALGGDEIMITFVLLTLFGFFGGLAQFLVYREELRLDRRWVIASTLCWGLGGGIIGGWDGFGQLLPSGYYVPVSVGIVGAVSSSFVQHRLLRLQPPAIAPWYWAHLWPWLMTFVAAFISGTLLGVGWEIGLPFGTIFGGILWLLSVGAVIRLAIERDDFQRS